MSQTIEGHKHSKTNKDEINYKNKVIGKLISKTHLHVLKGIQLFSS